MKQDAPREWFVITQEQPQQEQVAKLHYQRQGYVVYLSMMRTIVRHARRNEAGLKLFCLTLVENVMYIVATAE